MKPNDHIVGLWGDITAFVIAPLLILATTLRWAASVQIVLTVVFAVSIIGLRRRA
jgi:hypothetical protein